MRPLRSVAGKPLDWVRVGSRGDREFELRAGVEVVGLLGFFARLGDTARGRCHGGAWSFEPAGVTARTIRVSPMGILAAGNKPGADGPDGALDALPGGTLYPGGLSRAAHIEIENEAYRWNREGRFTAWWSLKDAGGPLVRARRVGLPVTGRGSVEILPSAFGRPELPILVLSAWYLLARRQGRTAG